MGRRAGTCAISKNGPPPSHLNAAIAPWTRPYGWVPPKGGRCVHGYVSPGKSDLCQVETVTGGCVGMDAVSLGEAETRGGQGCYSISSDMLAVRMVRDV